MGGRVVSDRIGDLATCRRYPPLPQPAIRPHRLGFAAWSTGGGQRYDIAVACDYELVFCYDTDHTNVHQSYRIESKDETTLWKNDKGWRYFEDATYAYMRFYPMDGYRLDCPYQKRNFNNRCPGNGCLFLKAPKKAAGQTAEQSASGGEYGFTVGELTAAGATDAELTATFTALKAAGASAGMLKPSGVSPPMLKNVGFDFETLLGAFSGDEMLAGGMTLDDVKKLGHSSVAALKAAGVSAKNLKATYKVSQLLAYPVVELLAAEVTLPELKSAGATADMLKPAVDAGAVTLAQLEGAGFSYGSLVGAFSGDELLAKGMPYDELAKMGHVTVEQLKGVGCSAGTLKARFSAKELLGTSGLWGSSVEVIEAVHAEWPACAELLIEKIKAAGVQRGQIISIDAHNPNAKPTENAIFTAHWSKDLPPDGELELNYSPQWHCGHGWADFYRIARRAVTGDGGLACQRRDLISITGCGTNNHDTSVFIVWTQSPKKDQIKSDKDKGLAGARDIVLLHSIAHVETRGLAYQEVAESLIGKLRSAGVQRGQVISVDLHASDNRSSIFSAYYCKDLPGYGPLNLTFAYLESEEMSWANTYDPLHAMLSQVASKARAEGNVLPKLDMFLTMHVFKNKPEAFAFYSEAPSGAFSARELLDCGVPHEDVVKELGILDEKDKEYVFV